MRIRKSSPITFKSFLALFDPLLIGLFGLSSFLNLFNLYQEGYGNTYYAAGVKSMLTSWHNFFFVSFDPTGFVSIDKPPLGFWIQSLSASIFGFSGWAIILPQAISGIISTLVIYLMVKQCSGRPAAILAALFFCITPITIATNRNNTIDSMVILTSLLATWALIQTLKTEKSRWLLVCMFFLGLGFNTKMLQAFLILPACLITYLAGRRNSIKEKISTLLLSGVVLISISFLWMTIVDLTPIDQRPYVGGSQTNSTFELAFNYNGISRWIGLPHLESLENSESGQPVDGILPDEIGVPGIFRLFTRQLAGQISWLLPISGLSLIFLLLQKLKIKFSEFEYQLTIFWGIWLITVFVFFSFATFYHRHYLVMMAPPISVLAGVGLEKSLSLSERKSWQSWFVPVFIIVGLITSLVIVLPFSTWKNWVLPFVIIDSLLAIIGLIIYQVCVILRPSISTSLRKTGLCISILCLVLPQILWAGIPVFLGGNGGLPLAGPEVLTWNRQPIDVDIKDLINTIIQMNQGEKYYLGTLDYDPAEWIILKTRKPVLAIGGFYGTDPILSSDKLASMVSAGEIRLFFVYEKTIHELRPDLIYWFHSHCVAQYSVPSIGEDYFQLYECKKN